MGYRKLTSTIAVALVAVVSGACSDDGGVPVTLVDYEVTVDGDVSAGENTFSVTNDAEQTHEFVIFRTDLPADGLPTDDEGVVDEAGEGLELVDEIEDIEAGSTQDLSVDLPAGSYVFLCNIPGHYQEGMATEVTVGG